MPVSRRANDLRIKAFHSGSVESVPNQAEISPSLEELGLKPIIGPTRSGLEERLRVLGIGAPAFDEDIEVYASANGGPRTVLTRLRRNLPLGRLTGAVEVPAAFDVPAAVEVLLVTNEESSDDFSASFTAAFPLTLQNQSSREAELLATLQPRLGELSPNGKLLCQQSIRDASIHLRKDQLRKPLKEIAVTFGGRPVPISSLAQLAYFENDSGILNSLLAGGPFKMHFQIACKGCGERDLTFSKKEQADETIAAAEGCPRCGKDALIVINTYSISESYLKALVQGLWLECLAGDTLKHYTNLVWVGQMVGPSEVDALAIFADRLVLVECKDTSFGLNDLDIAAAKAQRVGANVVIILTTSDIHPNVVGATTSARQTVLISDAESGNIENKMKKFLDELMQDFVRDWIKSRTSLSYWYSEPNWR
jgi:hypothetical protein